MNDKHKVGEIEITAWSFQSALMKVNVDGTLGEDVEGEVEVARVVRKQKVKFENRGQDDEALMHLYVDRDGTLYVAFAEFENCL